jgi:hypothetical protein
MLCEQLCAGGSKVKSKPPLVRRVAALHHLRNAAIGHPQDAIQFNSIFIVFHIRQKYIQLSLENVSLSFDANYFQR